LNKSWNPFKNKTVSRVRILFELFVLLPTDSCILNVPESEKNNEKIFAIFSCGLASLRIFLMNERDLDFNPLNRGHAAL
jgi:hypothetical protein